MAETMWRAANGEDVGNVFLDRALSPRSLRRSPYAVQNHANRDSALERIPQTNSSQHYP